MNDKIETPGLGNPESRVVKYAGFITYMVLLFTELNEAQIYKLPWRDIAHQEIEILMSFDYLKVFTPNEHTEDFYIRKPNNGNFLFKIEK